MCVCIFVCLGVFLWYSCVCVCVCVCLYVCVCVHACPQVKAQDFPPCLEWPSLSDDDDSQDMDVSFVRLPFAPSPFRSASLSTPLPALGASSVSFPLLPYFLPLAHHLPLPSRVAALAFRSVSFPLACSLYIQLSCSPSPSFHKPLALSRLPCCAC